MNEERDERDDPSGAAPEETALSMNWACAWEDSAMSLKHTSAN